MSRRGYGRLKCFPALIIFGEFALYTFGKLLELKVLELFVDRAVEFIDTEAKALIRYGQYSVLAKELELELILSQMAQKPMLRG